MFATSPEMRLPLESLLYPGHDVWEVVEVPLAIPLLVVKVAPRDARQSHPPRTFFTKAVHLAGFARTKGTAVLRADLLLPPNMSGRAGWALRRLDELWRCVEPDGTEAACWLFASEGRLYVGAG